MVAKAVETCRIVRNGNHSIQSEESEVMEVLISAFGDTLEEVVNFISI